MNKMNDIGIENAAEMSEAERMVAFFKKVTNKAIENYEIELEVVRATGDEPAKKRFLIQINMFRHAQSILDFAYKYATDVRWQNEQSN